MENCSRRSFLKGALFGTGALAVMGVPGCISATQDDLPAQDAAAPQSVEIQDLQDTTVRVPSPQNLKSFDASGVGTLGAAVLLGQVDKVKATPDTSKYPWLRQVYPQIATLPDFGSSEKVNVEELLKANFDVVVAPAYAATEIQKMRDVGIAVLVDGIDVDSSSDVFKQTYDEIKLISKLTGTEDIADAYFTWANDSYALVDARVKDLPDSRRKKAVPLRKGMSQVFAENCIWGQVVQMAGGVNMAAHSTEGEGGKFYADIDAEQMLAWNPDFIFAINFDGTLDDATADNYKTWAADGRYSGVPALEQGDVYLVPTGIDYWDSVVESPLCVMWMAKLMYPERFEDFDLKAYARDFYRRFLDHAMEDDEWQTMAPQYRGARTNGLSQ